MEENRRMKMEINKLQMSTQYSPSEDMESNSNMNNSYRKGFEEISEIAHDKKSDLSSMHVDSTSDMFTKNKYYAFNTGNSLMSAGRSLLSNSQYSRSQISENSIKDISVKK